jgi:hypothetical protein
MLLSKNFKKVVEYFNAKGAKKLFYGTERVAMCRGKFVYKIPRNFDGCCANFKEEYISRKVCKQKEALITYYGDSGVLGFARCRLVFIHEIPVLVMEKVTPLLDDDRRRTTFMSNFDGGQFGEGRRGDFLCYDYSRFYKHTSIKENPELEERMKTFYESNNRSIGGSDVAGFDSCFGTVKDTGILEIISKGGY